MLPTTTSTLSEQRSGPLTYRTYDGRRKARFLDILSLFNRIMNSKVRIAELEALRREQTRERVEFSQARNKLESTQRANIFFVKRCERSSSRFLVCESLKGQFVRIVSRVENERISKLLYTSHSFGRSTTHTANSHAPERERERERERTNLEARSAFEGSCKHLYLDNKL